MKMNTYKMEKKKILIRKMNKLTEKMPIKEVIIKTIQFTHPKLKE